TAEIALRLSQSSSGWVTRWNEARRIFGRFISPQKQQANMGGRELSEGLPRAPATGPRSPRAGKGGACPGGAKEVRSGGGPGPRRLVGCRGLGDAQRRRSIATSSVSSRAKSRPRPSAG